MGQKNDYHARRLCTKPHSKKKTRLQAPVERSAFYGLSLTVAEKLAQPYCRGRDFARRPAAVHCARTRYRGRDWADAASRVPNPKTGVGFRV